MDKNCSSVCISEKKNKSGMTVIDIVTHTYPEVVEGEVGQPHASDVFGQLFQHLRVLCLKSSAEK